MAQTVVFIVALAVIVLVVVDQVALWMARRGWIYWRKQPRAASGGGAMAGLLTEFQQLVEPEVRHVIQDREERRLGNLSVPADGRDKKPTNSDE